MITCSNVLSKLAYSNFLGYLSDAVHINRGYFCVHELEKLLVSAKVR